MKIHSSHLHRLPRAVLRHFALLVTLAGLSGAQAAKIPTTGISTTGTLGSAGAAATGTANMVDGNFGATSYQQFKGAGSVTLDMGSVQAVDRLVVVGRFSAGVPNLTQGSVEVSVDGIVWNSVKTIDNHEYLTGGTSFTGGTSLALGFAAQNARYVRLNITAATVNEQIGELQLYHGSGPRVSLIERGLNIQMTEPTRMPFNLVDGRNDTFVLYSGSSGDFTVRLDSNEYDEGWSAISLSGRSFEVAPANPGKLTIFAGDSLDSLVSIHTQTNEEESVNYDYLINLDATYHYQYVKVMWESNPDWGVTQSNVQFFEFDVLPIPEPATVAFTGIGIGLLAFARWRQQRKNNLS